MEGNATAILCSLSKDGYQVFDTEGTKNFYTDAKSDKFGVDSKDYQVRVN